MEMNSDRGSLSEADNDDVFYAEIRRQILLLTTEEEDSVGFLEETKRCFNPIISNGASKGSGYGFCCGLPVGSHFCSWEAQNCGGSPPVWLINLWKNGKGTGVFIPQVVRRKKDQRSVAGRMNSRRKVYKPVKNKD